MIKSVVLQAALVLPLAACGGNTPDPDRSAEAIATCETAVAGRLGIDRAKLTYDSSASRFGSGGWDVTGVIVRPQGGAVPFACGVYADGGRNDGPLRADGVRVPANHRTG